MYIYSCYMYIVVPEMCIIWSTICFSDLPKAADVAFQKRNLKALEDLQDKAGRRQEVVDYIKALKERLGPK